MNTTVGLLGTVDVANKMGFPKYEKEDYGQTLGKLGVLVQAVMWFYQFWGHQQFEILQAHLLMCWVETPGTMYQYMVIMNF